MNRRTLFSAVLAALTLTQCSSPEPEFTNLPGSFQFTKIQSDIFQVTYTAEAYTSMEQAERIAMQRVATLCLNEGFQFFVADKMSSSWLERGASSGYAPEHSAAGSHRVAVIGGQVRFFARDPKMAHVAVYRAEEVQQNLRKW